MRCWFCGEELIWGADFNSEDFGYEEGGIVATLHCPNCDAMFEGLVYGDYDKQLKEDDLNEFIEQNKDNKRLLKYLYELKTYRKHFNLIEEK